MGEFIPFFKIVLGKKSWRGKEFNKFLPSNSSDDLCILFCLYPSSMLPVWKLSTTVYKRIEPRLFICDSSSACSLFMDKSLYMFIYMWTFWSNPQFQWFRIRVQSSVSCSCTVCVYMRIYVFVYVDIHVQYTIAYTIYMSKNLLQSICMYLFVHMFEFFYMYNCKCSEVKRSEKKAERFLFRFEA